MAQRKRGTDGEAVRMRARPGVPPVHEVHEIESYSEGEAKEKELGTIAAPTPAADPPLARAQDVELLAAEDAVRALLGQASKEMMTALREVVALERTAESLGGQATLNGRQHLDMAARLRSQFGLPVRQDIGQETNGEI